MDILALVIFNSSNAFYISKDQARFFSIICTFTWFWFCCPPNVGVIGVELLFSLGLGGDGYKDGGILSAMGSFQLSRVYVFLLSLQKENITPC